MGGLQIVFPSLKYVDGVREFRVLRELQAKMQSQMQMQVRAACPTHSGPIRHRACAWCMCAYGGMINCRANSPR